MVHNKSHNYDIENCFLSAKTEKMNRLRKLEWSSNNVVTNLEYSPMTIRPMDYWRADILIAWGKEMNAVLPIFPMEEDDRIILPGIHRITISACGRFRGKYIEHKELFSFTYEGSNNLWLNR